jgi:hypothetical protein
MNTNMLATIDEDTLDQVSGGGLCIDPCAVIEGVVNTVGCVAEAGAELVCGVVEAKVNFATKLFGIFGC